MKPHNKFCDFVEIRELIRNEHVTRVYKVYGIYPTIFIYFYLFQFFRIRENFSGFKRHTNNVRLTIWIFF